VAAGQHHNFMIEIMARELLGDCLENQEGKSNRTWHK